MVCEKDNSPLICAALGKPFMSNCPWRKATGNHLHSSALPKSTMARQRTHHHHHQKAKCLESWWWWWWVMSLCHEAGPWWYCHFWRAIVDLGSADERRWFPVAFLHGQFDINGLPNAALINGLFYTPLSFSQTMVYYWAFIYMLSGALQSHACPYPGDHTWIGLWNL